MEQSSSRDIEQEVDELRALLVEQEHRAFPILKNFFIERKKWPKGDPRRDAVWKALIWRIFFSPGSVTIVGGAIGFFTVGMLIWQNMLIQAQFDETKRESQLQRRTELTATLYDSNSVGPVANERTRSEALFEFVELERNRLRNAAGERIQIHEKIRQPKTVDLRRSLLSGVSVFGIDLREVNLDGADLRGAGLMTANLSGVNLSWANLSGAELSYADLNGAHLLNANLSGANLGRANLSSANFGGASLRGAHLHNANLRGTIFFSVNLRGAILRSTNLSGATLIEANLSGVDFRRAKDLSQSQLDSAYIYKGEPAKLPEGLSQPPSRAKPAAE